MTAEHDRARPADLDQDLCNPSRFGVVWQGGGRPRCSAAISVPTGPGQTTWANRLFRRPGDGVQMATAPGALLELNSEGNVRAKVGSPPIAVIARASDNR
jgi:hypothetical protein